MASVQFECRRFFAAWVACGNPLRTFSTLRDLLISKIWKTLAIEQIASPLMIRLSCRAALVRRRLGKL
jgi:hypothetical protein